MVDEKRKPGKKPGKFGTKQPIKLKMSADVLEFLREVHPNAAGPLIEETIRKSKAFKEWLDKREVK